MTISDRFTVIVIAPNMINWDHLLAEKVLDDQLRSWWFAGKRLILDALLEGQIPAEARVLDVGAGQGLFTNHLAGSGRVVALDEWWDCLERNRRRGGCPVMGDAVQLPLCDDRFDYLFALDVLEHLPDDQIAIQEWARVLKPGGRIVINVPALDCLWSEHDVQMGHYRRYNRRTLRSVLERNGFVCERLTYSNSFLFPWAWLGFRLKLHQGDDANPEAHVPVPRLLYAAIVETYRIEAAWMRKLDVPFGGSLVAIARKQLPALSSKVATQ